MARGTTAPLILNTIRLARQDPYSLQQLDGNIAAFSLESIACFGQEAIHLGDIEPLPVMP